MSYLFSIYALLSLITTLGSTENIKYVQIQSSSDIVFERPGEAAVTVRDNEYELTVSENSKVLIEKGMEVAEWDEESKTFTFRFRQIYRFTIEQDGEAVMTITGRDATVTMKVSTD